MRPPWFDALVADLTGLQRRLRELLDGLGGSGWATPTPARGWNVRDQVAHLALVEEYAETAVRDPESFARLRAESVADPLGFETRLCERGRSLDGPGLLTRWERASTAVVGALAGAAPGARVPWFGPPMSVRSFLTARLMETWAHGHDVRDGLGAPPDTGPALRHVAHLGVSTRGWSHVVHGLDPPSVPVAVRLSAPGSEEWSWGEEAADRVTGPALDFCLVVTQRRHWRETGLVVAGAAAETWMESAQAFAGPATTTAPGRGLTKESNR